MSKDASSVGAIDLGIYSLNDNNNFLFFDKLKKNEFKLIYLLGYDQLLPIEKKNEFIIYQGSHGDQGAEIADMILPGAAYTEKNGLFVNTEGRLQKAYKATYAPGFAKEDWKIINELSEYLGKPLNFNNHREIENKIYNEIPYYLNFDKNLLLKNLKPNNNNIVCPDKKIEMDYFDYYYSNVIARASKTMHECKQVRKNFLKTRTEE